MEASERSAVQIARLSLLAAATVAAFALVGCATGNQERAPAASIAPDVPAEPIEGTYSHLVTEDQLRAAGVTDPSGITENVGSYLFSFEDGRWRYEQRAIPPSEAPDVSGTGSYTWEGNRLTIYWSQIHRDNRTTGTVGVLPDGSLVFSDIEDAWGQEMSVGFFQGSPWTRVEP